MPEQMNYTLGRGELHFAKFKDGTRVPGGERYIGNSPEFAVNIENEELEHYNSDRGIREKDESITLQTNRTASFTTDHIAPENLALFFFGSKSELVTTGGNITDEVVAEVELGLTYQLGMSEQNPVGARNISSVAVKDEGGSTTYALGDDYEIDLALARLTPLVGGAITEGSNLKVDYTEAAGTRDRIISGSQAIEGALRYISFNPAGKQFDWYMPWVKISPNGDFTLKSDEWQTIPFSVEILKMSNMEAIYVDGRPLVS